MGKVLVNETSLQGIANSIRGKNGTETTYKPSEMAAAIDAIETGGNSNDDATRLVIGTITEYSNDNITEIRDYAFYDCSQLTTIDIPNVTNIGDQVFAFCASLTSVNFDSVTVIGQRAFSDCTGLQEIYLPSLQYNGVSMAFYNCPNLIRAELGELSALKMYDFYGCSSIETIILRKTDAICTLHAKTFYNGDAVTNGTGYIYVPAALLEEYKAATNWTVYADQIRAIEDYPDICGGAT